MLEFFQEITDFYVSHTAEIAYTTIAIIMIGFVLLCLRAYRNRIKKRKAEAKRKKQMKEEAAKEIKRLQKIIDDN